MVYFYTSDQMRGECGKTNHNILCVSFCSCLAGMKRDLMFVQEKGETGSCTVTVFFC